LEIKRKVQIIKVNRPKLKFYLKKQGDFLLKIKMINRVIIKYIINRLLKLALIHHNKINKLSPKLDKNRIKLRFKIKHRKIKRFKISL
jgi:hypothetical protein